MVEPDPQSRARELLRAAHGRVTPARLGVLQVLLASPAALSHYEIEDALQRSNLNVDRVTLYRVLDWLVEHELAHRIAAADRAWRFNATDRGSNGDHAHFHCTVCGQIVCLKSRPPADAVNLPRGYLPERTDITIRGRCPRCAD
jgi:Fur family transcriptional regulator, ferric uptake regulator